MTKKYTISLLILSSIVIGQFIILPKISEAQQISNPEIDQVPIDQIFDGDLIRLVGDPKVWVVKFIGTKKFRRWMPTRPIIDSYGHLRNKPIKVVNLTTFNLFQESHLIRSFNDFHVFWVDDFQKKHWFDVSAANFINNNFDFDGVFIVNIFEATAYPEGTKIYSLDVNRIIVFSPTLFESFRGKTSMNVDGTAEAFEATINIRLRSPGGFVFLETPVMTRAPDAGQFGEFNKAISIPATTLQSLILEVFDISAATGEEINKVVIPISLL